MENTRPDETVAIANLETMTLEDISCVLYKHAVAQLETERKFSKSVEDYDMYVEVEKKFIKRMREQSPILEILYLRAKVAAVHEMDRNNLMTMADEREAEEAAQRKEIEKSIEEGLNELERRLMKILKQN